MKAIIITMVVFFFLVSFVSSSVGVNILTQYNPVGVVIIPSSDGFFKGDMVYGEMWMNNQSSTGRVTVINTLGVWENVTGFDQTGDNGGQMLNGVTFTNNALNVNVDGLYKLDYSISFERISGGVGREFEIGLNINGQLQNKTKIHRATSNVNDVGSASHTGFMRLNSTSNLHLMIRNRGGIEDVGTHNANVNLIRIGN